MHMHHLLSGIAPSGTIEPSTSTALMSYVMILGATKIQKMTGKWYREGREIRQRRNQ